MTRPATNEDVIDALDDVLELTEITHPTGGYRAVSPSRAAEVVAHVDQRAAHRSGTMPAVKASAGR